MTIKSRLAKCAGLLAIVGALGSGCASTTSYQLYLKSDPTGAMIYQDGTSHGRCPIVLNYEVSADDKKKGYKSIAPLNARWVSGAVSEKLKGTKVHKSKISEFTFVRPDFDKVEVDAIFAIELERNGIMRGQTAAAQKAAAAASKDSSWNNADHMINYMKMLEPVFNK